MFYNSAKININMVGEDSTLKICPLKEAISMFGGENSTQLRYTDRERYP